MRGGYRKIKLDLESPERDLRVFLPSGSEGLKVRVAKEIVFLVSPSGSWVEGEPTRMRGLFQPFSVSLYFGICICWGGLHGNQTPTVYSAGGDVSPAALLLVTPVC